MGLNKEQRVRFREILKKCLLEEDSLLYKDEAFFFRTVFPLFECQVKMPCKIGDYTDFYASRDHAVNAGTLFRGKDNALQPNWVHLPVGYHGRASSVIQSPCTVIRPNGQLDEGKTYGPCKRLDFELEIGVFLGGEENPLGCPISVNEARNRIFGFVLLNDWSARDVQAWEYVPLGPFCAKNFCTTISPWIIPVEALEEYKIEPISKQNPTPLPYLRDDEFLLYNMDLFCTLKCDKKEETVLTKTNFRNIYWTPAQMIAHHSSTGCNMCAGDLLGTGTISGPEPYAWGSLLEITSNGKNPLKLKTGEQRTFLQDGDTVTLSGSVIGGGIGFGECTGTILPPKDFSKL